MYSRSGRPILRSPPQWTLVYAASILRRTLSHPTAKRDPSSRAPVPRTMSLIASPIGVHASSSFANLTARFALLPRLRRTAHPSRWSATPSFLVQCTHAPAGAARSHTFYSPSARCIAMLAWRVPFALLTPLILTSPPPQDLICSAPRSLKVPSRTLQHSEFTSLQKPPILLHTHIFRYACPSAFPLPSAFLPPPNSRRSALFPRPHRFAPLVHPMNGYLHSSNRTESRQNPSPISSLRTTAGKTHPKQRKPPPPTHPKQEEKTQTHKSTTQRPHTSAQNSSSRASSSSRTPARS
jgi:hypothetical protein